MNYLDVITILSNYYVLKNVNYEDIVFSKETKYMTITTHGIIIYLLRRG